MGKIADIFTRYFPGYLERFGDQIPQQHLKVAKAIINCRTGAYGVSFFSCTKCGKVHTVSNCCGNRHCPSCQQHKNILWGQRQRDKLLPVTYFMVGFSMPQELREFIRSNQRLCYTAMFKSASDTLKELLADKKRYGIDTPGFLGVLHTWGRSMPYHPHIHFIVPGGGLRKDGTWKSTTANFLIPIRAASRLFRGKFYSEIKKNSDLVPPKVYDKEWVVSADPRGDGRNSLKYLAPYVFKVAISDNRIVSYNNGKVIFEYRPTGLKEMKTMELDATQFIHRFLQHVLPKGFMKVRHYGFLSSNPTKTIPEIRRLIDEEFAILMDAEKEKPTVIKGRLKCSCGCRSLKFIYYSRIPIINNSG